MFRIFFMMCMVMVSGRSYAEAESFHVIDKMLKSNFSKNYYLHEASFEASDSDSVVYIVYDFPLNLKAQLNATRVFHFLFHYASIDFLATESSHGLISYADFEEEILKLYPEEDARQKHYDYLLAEGRLNALGYYDLVQSFHVPLWGIDDEGLYGLQSTMYVDIVHQYQEMNHALQVLLSSLDAEKEALWNDSLKNFMRKRPQEGSMAYLSYLLDRAYQQLLHMDQYRNLNHYVGVLELKSTVNMDMVQQELTLLRQALVSHYSVPLKEMLQDIHVHESVKQVIQSLLYAKSFEATLMSAIHRNALTEPYFLEDFLLSVGMDLKAYPELLKFANYLKTFATVNLWAAQKELKQIEQDIVLQLTETESERELIRFEQILRMILGLSQGQLARDDWQYYQSEIQGLDAEKYPKPLLAYAPKLISLWSDVEEYYRVATRRSRRLSQRLLQIMTEQKAKQVIVFCTAFNVEQMKQDLQAANVSYCVIRPREGTATVKERQRYNEYVEKAEA